MRRYLPDAIVGLSLESQYRIGLDADINRLEEASRAFGLGENLELDNIFVDVSMINSMKGVMSLIGSSIRKPKGRMEAFSLTEAGFKRFREVIDFFEAEDSFTWTRDEFKGQEHTTVTYRIRLNLADLLRKIQQRVERNTSNFLSLLQSSFSANKVADVLQEGIDSSGRYSNLLDIESIRQSLSLYLKKTKTIERLPSLTVSELVHIELPVLIVGGPGAGKTTLLRRMVQLSTRNSELPTPILVNLVGLEDITVSGLLEECIRQLDRRGFQLKGRGDTSSRIRRQLKAGGFRLFLDGLDELGEQLGQALEAIESLQETYPKSAIVLSCRDTFPIEWNDAVPLRLRPFSDSQMSDFIEKWFTAEPTACIELLDYLKKNVSIRDIARTPLIAGLLCTLHSAGGELPVTEVDLYEKRLDLLLTRWDRAKRIKSLPAVAVKAYEFFLTGLARRIHEKETRWMAYSDVVEVSQEFRVLRLHEMRNSLVVDCINRGLLSFDKETDEISFGHLTFQEHLAAKSLQRENAVEKLRIYCDKPWWRKTLEFYSALQGDITPLIRFFLADSMRYSDFENLNSLAKFAPFTSRSVLRKLNTMPRN